MKNRFIEDNNRKTPRKSQRVALLKTEPQHKQTIVIAVEIMFASFAERAYIG